VMPAWYDILGADLISQQDAVGIKRSENAITALIDRELGRGISHQNIVLAGFSQGCAMVLHTGLRYPQALGGIMALSGYLPLKDSFIKNRNPANQETPIFLAHGEWDSVITLDRSEYSKEVLVDNGYAVQWQTYAMEHSVHPHEIVDIGNFLRRVLAT